MWEKRGDLFPMWEYFSLPSELVSQYSCSKNPPETEDIDRKHENDAKTYGPVLTYGQCFFVDKCLIGASDWFCNLKDSVLCEFKHCASKIFTTYISERSRGTVWL